VGRRNISTITCFSRPDTYNVKYFDLFILITCLIFCIK